MGIEPVAKPEWRFNAMDYRENGGLGRVTWVSELPFHMMRGTKVRSSIRGAGRVLSKNSAVF